MHLRHDIDAVDDERSLARHPQRDVEDGPVLGDVDPLPREHRVATFADLGVLGERDEQSNRLLGDAVLRVVEEEPRSLGREPVGPARVAVEEIAKVRSLQLLGVGLERLPGR